MIYTIYMCAVYARRHVEIECEAGQLKVVPITAWEDLRKFIIGHPLFTHSSSSFPTFLSLHRFPFTVSLHLKFIPYLIFYQQTQLLGISPYKFGVLYIIVCNVPQSQPMGEGKYRAKKNPIDNVLFRTKQNKCFSFVP